MKKVVGYVRVSTDSQARKGASLETQKDKIRAWANIQDQDLICIEEDAGISGKLIRNREGLKQAIEVACDEEAVLVVYSLSRLSRSTRDTLALVEKLDKAGADLVSLSERIDTTTAAGKMVFRMLAVLNEFEREVFQSTYPECRPGYVLRVANLLNTWTDNQWNPKDRITGIQYALENGWIEEHSGNYKLTDKGFEVQ